MEWLDRLAQALELNAPTNEEVAAVLEAARDVAHGVERRITPVSTFLLGRHVEHLVAAGTSREEALASSIEALRATLPTGPAEEGSGQAG
jgi:aryl-alcohol dehydrogenase-like predicted oxidoreductase